MIVRFQTYFPKKTLGIPQNDEKKSLKTFFYSKTFFPKKTLGIPQNDEKIVKKICWKTFKVHQKNNAEKNNAEGSSGDSALFFLYERE